MGLMYKIRGSFGKKEINGKEVLCYCKKVTRDEVNKAIANGARSVEEVGRVTKAGTVCGTCKSEIQKMIDRRS